MHRPYARYARKRLLYESGMIIQHYFRLNEAHNVPKRCAVVETRAKSYVDHVSGRDEPANE